MRYFLTSSEPSSSSSSLSSSLSLPTPLTVLAITPAVSAVGVNFKLDPFLSRVTIRTIGGSKSSQHFPDCLVNTASPPKFFGSRFRKYSWNSDPTCLDGDDNDNPGDNSDESEPEMISEDNVRIKIEELGNNSRRIYSRIGIDAPLEAVWNILTDYERLADFIPGLALSQLLHKTGNHARLFQVGQQNLAFGLKFNAKGIVDCYENDLERLPFGKKRVIKFKMIEGDFQLFEGEWSIEQFDKGRCQDGNLQDQEIIHTSLSYWVDVKPKLWLPVRLVEGRLCDEIKMNLMCIREEAHKEFLKELMWQHPLPRRTGENEDAFQKLKTPRII